jgi:hypothetical protein
MLHTTRREFFADVGRGMLIVSLGPAMATDLGLGPACAGEDSKDVLSFGTFEPLAALMQETPSERLLPILVERLQTGTELRELVAAAVLANARQFGGEHYRGFHAFMALAPSYRMASELPEQLRPVPVLKVLYRNTELMQSAGGRAHETLRPNGAPDDARSDRADVFLEANRSGNIDRSERAFAAITRGGDEHAFRSLVSRVRERADVHTTVLLWRAWESLEFVGRKHAQTLLRQSVRHCITEDAGLPCASLVPRMLDDYRLVGRDLGTKPADAAWIEQTVNSLLTSTPERAMEIVAGSLSDGFGPELVGEATALAANQLVLRQVANWEGVLGRRAHGDSPGVHASDAVNAWRNIARVGGTEHRAAALLLAAANVAYSHRPSDDPRYRGHDAFPYPTDEQLEQVANVPEADLLRETDAAIRANDQFRACALVHRQGELGHAARPVFDLLLHYAISEDGRLHGEKYYRTATEEFAATRPEFRWRQLVALARVTASAYGYNLEDEHEPGRRAPGYDEARRLLGA